MSSSVSIHWCSLVSEQEEVVRSALRELSQKLKDRYPGLPQVEICQLSPSESEQLPAFLGQQLGASQSDDSPANSLHDKRVFVFCKGDEPFAIEASNQNKQAVWGAAQMGRYALAWTPNNKYLLWHEAMHLLYAHECYDAKGQRTCEEACCVMQHVPCEKSCGGDLYLCSANVRWLTAFWSNQPLQPTGTAMPFSQGSKSLGAAPAAELDR